MARAGWKALVAGAGLIAGCSRCGASSSPSRAVDASAAGGTAVAAGPSDSGEQAAADAGVQASPAIEVALEKAPPLTIRAVGPSLIEVALGDGGAPMWKTVEVERHVVPDGRRQRDTFDRSARPYERSASKRHIHSAKPATTYAYRARSTGPWSPEVTVRTAEPAGAPPVPTAFAVTAITPFAVKLTWEADARMAAGFEIEVASSGNEYARAALVDATVRELVQNHRLPKREYAYRIRAFNQRAVSPPSGEARVTTPDHGTVQAATLPPCKAVPPTIETTFGLPQQVVNGDGAHPLYNVPEGTSGLRRHFFGVYEGCSRDFGAFELQDGTLTVVEGYVDEGFPLVRAVAGAGEYVGAQIYTMRFARGRYTLVDVANFCGSPHPDPNPADPSVGTEGGADLTGYTPPFETCQRDFEP